MTPCGCSGGERDGVSSASSFTVEEGDLLVTAVRLFQGAVRREAARTHVDILRARFPLAGLPLCAQAPDLKAVADTIAALEALS